MNGAPDWAALDAKYPTSGLAVLDLPAPWSAAAPGTATLRSFTIPRG